MTTHPIRWLLIFVLLTFQAWMIQFFYVQGTSNRELWATSGRATVDGRYPITNVALMGLFNYDTPLEKVLAWIKIWSKYFSKIVIVGPFNENTYELARELGIDLRLGPSDAGFVSPTEDLMNVVLDPPAGVEAILYVHDDGLLNITELFQGKRRIPTDRFMGILPSEMTTYAINMPRNTSLVDQITFEHLGFNSTPPTNNSETFILDSQEWCWQRHWCLARLLQMLMERSKEVQQYAHSSTETSSRFIFLGGRTDRMFSGMGDFLLVPLSHRDTFVRLARLFLDYAVFLECSLPNIVFWTMQHDLRLKNALKPSHFTSDIFKEQAYHVDLCSQFTDAQPYPRGTVAMLKMCSLRNGTNVHGFYHPYKMSVYSTKNYSLWLDRLQGPWNDSWFDDMNQ